MKKTKLIFIISVLATSVVVFNSLIDLTGRLWANPLNFIYLISFLIIIGVTTWYVLYNWGH